MYVIQGIFNLLLILMPALLLSCDQQQNRPISSQKSVQPQYHGTIITLGDSLTAGLGVAETKAWPALIENELQENGYNWQVINAGISGETSSGVLSRIQWILARKPDIVILETGANDGLRGIPVNVIRDNINKTVQTLKNAEVTVILAGMQIVQNLGKEYTEAFANIYPDVAKENDILLIPFFLLDVAGEPNLNQADSIHPNERGHQVIMETVYPFIERAIQETD